METGLYSSRACRNNTNHTAHFRIICSLTQKVQSKTAHTINESFSYKNIGGKPIVSSIEAFYWTAALGS